MARFEFKMSKEWEYAVMKLDTLYDDACEDMLNAGIKIVAERLKAAGNAFAKFIKIKKPRRNQHGWYAQVQFKGKTSSGIPAAMAANVSEYGREGYNPQPARPFIRATVQSSEADVAGAMQEVLEGVLNKL